jgi:hypothetical protein
MSAVGTFNDGSQQHLKCGVFWNRGSPTVAILDSAGLVEGIAPGQRIITRSRETMTASATVTVTLGGITSIQVSSFDGLSSIRYGSTEQFVATANASGQQIDVTNSVTWSANPRSIPNLSLAAEQRAPNDHVRTKNKRSISDSRARPDNRNPRPNELYGRSVAMQSH